jgi:hypothetical protein
VAITFPELGNALNSYLTPIIFEKSQKLGTPLMFSFGLCVVGFLCAVTAAFLDLRADKVCVLLWRSMSKTTWCEFWRVRKQRRSSFRI